MAMRNNLNNTVNASSFKQVKHPNGKYDYISLPSGIMKCEICGKNYQIMKMFEHIRRSHHQYFCIMCRARFKIHKDLICHIKDTHQLVASDNLNEAQDAFSDSVNKRYFAQPLMVSRLPIPPTTNSQRSNSSSEDDELHLDNVDVLDMVLGTKTYDEHGEGIEISNIIKDTMTDLINDVNAEELFESTLQDLNCSDLSIIDESENKTINKLDTSENSACHLHYISTDNDDKVFSNKILSEINELSDHKSSQVLQNVEEEFKLGIKNMSTILSENHPWINGTDTLQNNNNSENNDLLVMALTLDNKLTDMKLSTILKECIKTSCLTCVYCHNSTCIAVNGKQLALHMIEKHRFMTVKNESSEEVVNILKSNLNILENVFFNSENFDSNDELCHTSFNNTFYCFNCQFTSKQIKDVNSHKRSVHSRKTYDCIMCKIIFSNYGELYCHLCPGAEFEAWQNLSFRCLFCGLSHIPSAFRCMVHLRKAHNACDYCLETFPNQQSLALHVNKHKMRHMCLKCNISYFSKKDIFEHMFWKHNTDSKVCKLCLTKKWPYTYHFCVPPAIFSCDECKRTFSNALLLRVHKRWHSDNIPYECNTCHNKFISKKLLKKHEIIHKELISPTKKKKTKKKRGDDYNLPPLNLSSDSDTEKTPRYKPEKCLKSPSPNGNYWDYVSKQKKELVHIALLDHDYTLSTKQSNILNSPQYLDESTSVVNGSEKVFNNSLNNLSCQRSSCSSHCNSSSSSSSCGSNCSCSSSYSSSSDSDTVEKKKTIVESPKKHKKKKKEKKIKVLSAKKIANFNLNALETDLESEFLDTDTEEYYDINPLLLHPEYTLTRDIQESKQENFPQNTSSSLEINNSISLNSTLSNGILGLDNPLNNPHKYSNSDAQVLENNGMIDAAFHNEYKISDAYEIYTNNDLSTNNLSYNDLLLDENQGSFGNNINTNSTELCNGNNNLNSKKNKLSLTIRPKQEFNNSYCTKPSTTRRLKNPILDKRQNKCKSKLKTFKQMPQYTEEVTYTSHLENSSHSVCTTNLNKTMSPNDTRQSKRQPKKRKFFGYDSSDEEQIPNGETPLILKLPSHPPSSKKNKQKRNSKPQLPFQLHHHTTNQLIQSQQARPIVDARISKTVVPTVTCDTDSDSGNLIIELPKCIEQKSVQSTERLYCHCRCPYDEVSEMIACDNKKCRVEWFHFDCVGITVAPKGNWYCPDCR